MPLASSASSKFELGISEIVCPRIHVSSNFILNNNSNIVSKFLVYTTYTAKEFYDNEHVSLISMVYNEFNNLITNNTIITHPYIRNYREIAKNFIRFDILSIEVLETGETVCTIHTHLIKIIQRKWRKIYNERKTILMYRKKLRNLRERELTGKYKVRHDYPDFKLGL